MQIDTTLGTTGLDSNLDAWLGLYGKESEGDFAIRADCNIATRGWQRGHPLPNNSVDLVLGSPPFATGVPYPSGYVDDKSCSEIEYELGSHLVEIARVLKPGRLAFLNLPLVTYVRGVRISWLDLGTRLMEEAGLVVGGPPLLVTLGGIPVPSGAPPSVWPPFGIGADIVLWGSSGEPRFTAEIATELNAEEWESWKGNLWNIEAEYDLDVLAVNPVPWSREIPYRLALLASMPGELIVDPWCGSGRTAAALMGGANHTDHPIRPRRFLGQDLVAQIAKTRNLLERDWSRRARPWTPTDAQRQENQRVRDLLQLRSLQGMLGLEGGQATDASGQTGIRRRR